MGAYRKKLFGDKLEKVVSERRGSFVLPDKDKGSNLLSVSDLQAVHTFPEEQVPVPSETPSYNSLKVIQKEKEEEEEEESLFDSPREKTGREKRRPMKLISATQKTPEIVMERLETA